ncbi:MAG TPA: zinc-binding alcohol dehydrogenase [Chthonomonadales bacterium]|nr:zinc-binding alcohol dehydrogenase [Chthonomonadales bacterium]
MAVTAREKAELLPVEVDSSPLGPREVRGRTLASVISAGTELHWCYTGNRFPAYPGYAAVFQIEECGAEVTSIKPGDRALCMGGHRSHQRTTEEKAVRVPDGLDPQQAAFARLMNVTMSTLVTTTARPPDLVLVTGLGPVGHLGAQVFASCGYNVVSCDPSCARRAIAESAGRCGRVLPAPPRDDPTVAGRVSLALECAGHEGAALDCIRMVRKRGEVVLVGTPWRRYTDASAHDLVHEIFHRYAVVRSGWEWEVPLHGQEFCTGNMYGNLAAALEWLAGRRVAVEGLYEATAPADVQRTYQDLLAGRWPRLAAVLDWSRL